MFASEIPAATAPRFQFGTKAETLERLSGLLRIGRLPPQIHFTCAEWRDRAPSIIARIIDTFPRTTLAVRSSSRSEDTHDESGAGAFASVLGVAARPDALGDAIAHVIASYGDNDNLSQVLVQPVIAGVVISGVVLTRDLATGAPYYVVNYDDMSGRTDTVTGGAINKLLLVLHGRESSLRSERFHRLIDCVREIEAATGGEPLDIEFCIDAAQQVHVLQVRPLVARRRWAPLAVDAMQAALADVRRTLGPVAERDPGYRGARTIYGEMPDWNPAEMIGTAPAPLALSLYKSLITDATWLNARMTMGYARLPVRPLLRDFAGRPYIDVRRSLNSFLPAGLDDAFSERLIDHQLALLEANPSWHDKIEFRVATTSLDFAWSARANELREAGFAADDVATFGARLRDVTAAALKVGAAGVRDLLAAASPTEFGEREPRARARLLLDHAATGTHAFAVLARHAFISAAFLRSLVARTALTAERSAAFMASIRTVAADLVDAISDVSSGVLDRAVFLARFGHLRPGTYDIASHRYDERPDLYLGGATRGHVAEPAFVLTAAEHDAVRKLLGEAGLSDNVDGLFGYMAAAIAAREEAKFKFTRDISDALAALCDWGAAHDLDREDLAFADILALLNSDDIRALRERIARAHTQHSITRAVRLPSLIASPVDVDAVRIPLGQPTFITTTRVSAPGVRIAADSTPDIDDRIVLIEHADPGYDWIFCHRVRGLVTKYGGANSHMAIRCAEFNLPAAIGCGERTFAAVLDAPSIELDCAAGAVRGVRL